ncbi:MAG: hypothetical protein ABDH23_02880 [Endomicrobiia bacterium]
MNSILEELKPKDNIETAIIGAVDAMIYDVACALDFTKVKKKLNIKDWSSYQTRKELLKEIFRNTL